MNISFQLEKMRAWLNNYLANRCDINYIFGEKSGENNNKTIIK